MFRSFRVRRLIKQLYDRRWYARASAIEKLGRLGDARAIEPLIDILVDSDKENRAAAAKALRALGEPQWSKWVKGDSDDFARLGKSKAPRAVEPLIKALNDGAWPVSAAEALGKSGDTRAVKPLIRALRERDEDVRQEAAKALGKLCDTRAVEPLIGALNDRDKDVCQEAAKALGNLGDGRAVEPLIKALEDKESFARMAAEALGNLGDTRAFEPLIKALGDRDCEVCEAAAEALGNLGDARAVEPLIKGLGDGTWHVREAAVYALGKLGDDRAVDPLIRALGNSDDNGRKAAAEALGELGNTRAVDPLTNMLCDSWNSVRRAASEALFALGEPQWSKWVKGDDDDFKRLGKSKNPRVLELLIKALGDGTWDARKAAAKALAKLGEARALEPLIKALGDHDKDVRKAAAKGLRTLGEPQWLELVKGDDDDFERLGESKDARAVEPMIKALGDGEVSVRWAAAEALGKLGDARAVEPLIKSLGDHDKDVRNAAAAALRALGEPQWSELVKGDYDDFGRLGESKDARAVEPLIKALGDGEVSVRWAAAEALGKLGDARAVEPLIKALGDGEGSVRRAAAEALGNLGDDRAVEPLIKALGREGSVRRVSAEALGKLGDVRAVEPLIKALGDGEGSVRLAAAEALSTLSELRWAEWVKGDDEDFTRLSLSGESNAVELLLIALGDANRDVRLAAAEAMRALDEPQWSEWIKGDSNDFERLGESGDPRAVGLLVRALKNEDMDIVEEAVAALRKIKPMEAEQLILENVDSIQRGIHRIKKFLRHEIFLTDYKLWLHKIVQILKSEGMLASNTLAKLILTLLDCRNPDIWVVLDVSGEMPPTSELIDAVVKVAEAEGLTSIIPQNMPYLSEIVGQGKIGWTDETEERIKSVANRVLKQLARK